MLATTKQSSKAYFERVARKLGIQQQADWYRVTFTDAVKKVGNSEFKNTYAFVDGIQRAYPQFEWFPWLFQNFGIADWKGEHNQRKIMDWAGEELGIVTQEDWYHVSLQKVHEIPPLRSLVTNVYASSISKALKQVYPEFKWLPWRFSKVHSTFWDSYSNQREYFDWLKSELGIEHHSGWYSVPYNTVIQHGGFGILSLYQNSLINALRSIYPEETFYPWCFASSPRNWWKTEHNTQLFFKWMSVQLGISETYQWSYVSFEQIEKIGGGTLLKRTGGLHKLLEKYFPDQDWSTWITAKTQQVLIQTLRETFAELNTLKSASK